MLTENNFPCGEPHQMLIVNCSTVVSVFQCKCCQVKLGVCLLLSSQHNDIKCKEGWLRIEHRQGKSLNQGKNQRHTLGVRVCLYWAAAGHHLSCHQRGEQRSSAGSLVEQGKLQKQPACKVVRPHAARWQGLPCV